MPGTSDTVVSACVADGTLPRLVTSATKADILVKGPTNYRKGILNFLHPDQEINNRPFNKTIMVLTQVLERRWGSRTMILVLFCRWTQPEVQFRLLHRLTGQGLTARFICCKKTILGNDPKRIRRLLVPCGKGQFLRVCYCDQAHVTWGSCGSKQPYLKCCGFFFFRNHF